jgi:hypothetical protein
LRRPRVRTSSGWTLCRPRSKTACSPASWQVDAAVGDQLADGQSADLAPDRVEAGDGDRLRGVVDDEVDPGGRLEGADVAALASDEPPLHVVGGEGDDGDRPLSDELAGVALQRGRDDLLRLGGRLLLGRLLDLADLGGDLGARVGQHLVGEALAGLVGGEAGDLLEPPLGLGLGLLRLLRHRLGGVLAAVEVLGPLLQLAVLPGRVGQALLDLLLALDQRFFLAREVGAALSDLVLGLCLDLERDLLAFDLRRLDDLAALLLGGGQDPLGLGLGGALGGGGPSEAEDAGDHQPEDHAGSEADEEGDEHGGGGHGGQALGVIGQATAPDSVTRMCIGRSPASCGTSARIWLR